MSQKNKKVSIIVSAYNEELRIGECLASLARQDYGSYEIILTDDGSYDNTVSIAKKFPVKIIKNNHLGTAKSRNKAASQATGEILAFLDADMTFEPNFLSKLVLPINKGLSKGTFSKLEYVKNWDNPIARLWNWVNNPDLPDKYRVSQKSSIGEDFRAIITSEFHKVGGFDDTGYTDTWSLAKKLGYKPTNASGAIYYHYNPETYDEVLHQAAWIGRRAYKYGLLGDSIAFARANFVSSILKGALLMVKKKEVRAIPFHLHYDAGIMTGILSRVFSGKRSK